MQSTYAIFTPESRKMEYVRCVFNLGMGTFCSNAIVEYKHTLIDCIINSDIKGYTYRALFGHDSIQQSGQSGGYGGVVYMKDCINNYPGSLGFTNSYKGDILPKDNEAELKMIKRLFLGISTDVPFRTTPIENPEQGDMYFDVSNSVLKRCTTAGQVATCGFTLNSNLSSPVTVVETVTLNENEVITFNFNNVSSVDELRNVVVKRLEELGYRASKKTFSEREPGTYQAWHSGSWIITITSKYQTALAVRESTPTPGVTKYYANCVSPSGSSYPITTSGREFSDVYAYNSVQGTNPVWEDVMLNNGLIYRIEQLEG
jgi:hypothetical protein